MAKDGGAHPRREPRLSGALTLERFTQVFHDCADFSLRRLRLWGEDGPEAVLCSIVGMARTERVND